MLLRQLEEQLPEFFKTEIFTRTKLFQTEVAEEKSIIFFFD